MQGEATLIMIRHARTVWNAAERYAGHQEVPLAPEAEQQIRRLTHELVKQPIDAIYSSPLSRCLLTVGPTAEILGLPIGIDDRLRERDLGAWEGAAAADLRHSYPDFHFPDSAYDGRYAIPGAESLEDLTARTKSILDDISLLYSGKTVVLSTHAGVIWSVTNHLLASSISDHRWPENSSSVQVVWPVPLFAG